MSAGKPMYFLWRLNMIRALGWRSPRMGKIGCYVIRLIGASIDRGITFLDRWSAYMHGGLGFPWMWWMWRTYGRDATGSRVIRDILMVSKVQTWIEVESESNQKTRLGLKVEMGALGAKCEGKEWWGKVHFMTSGLVSVLPSQKIKLYIMNHTFPDLIMCLHAISLAHSAFQCLVSPFNSSFEHFPTFKMPSGHPSHLVPLVVHPVGSLKTWCSGMFKIGAHICTLMAQAVILWLISEPINPMMYWTPHASTTTTSMHVVSFLLFFPSLSCCHCTKVAWISITEWMGWLWERKDMG